MKKSKFTDQQIAFALQQAEAGKAVEEVCRKMGVSQTIFYRWEKVYGGLMLSEVRRLGQLEEENARLRRIVVDPHAWLADTLARIPDYKITKVDDLLPWQWNR